MGTTYADSWSDMAQPCDIDLLVIKWRSASPVFHSSVILSYILKTIWCMNIVVWNNESVWLNVWPQNKCRSLRPIFHGPVILPFILKTIWCMNIIIWDYESVWPKVWPQNKCRSLWPMFHSPLILPYILKTIWCMKFIIWGYESVWPEVWPQNKCTLLAAFRYPHRTWPNSGPDQIILVLKISTEPIRSWCCLHIHAKFWSAAAVDNSGPISVS